MNLPRVLEIADVGPGRAKPVSIRMSFVAERIEAGGDHESRRLSRQIAGAKRGGPQIRSIRLREVLLHVPDDALVRDDVCVLQRSMRRSVEREVESGIDQHLTGRDRPTRGRRELRHHRREIPSG